MNHYLKISFNGLNAGQKDVLVGTLSTMGVDGFEEGNNFLVGYANALDFDSAALEEMAERLGVRYEMETIAEQNWNAEWEQSFEPVLIDDFCAIRASFHLPDLRVVHDIIITPKMSFGTGHHATTYMMVQWMQKIDHRNRIVLDFGTGTGVLAILAEKLGARRVNAIDNDDWSIENARENIDTNNSHSIILEKADKLSFDQPFDIILANINRNVILSNMGALKQHLAVGGVLVLSGLLQGDLTAIDAEARLHKLKITGELEKNGWISLQLTHF